MTTTVETRRLRTWDSDAPAATQASWRILVRYGLLRMSRTWYLAVLGIILAVGDVTLIASMSYDLGQGNHATPGTLMGVATFLLMPAFVALVVLGTATFADDLRFNAPLFYFSRPLRPDDYIRGKVVPIAIVLAVLCLLPLVVFLLLGTVLGSTSGAPPDVMGQPMTGARLADYERQHIMGVGEWAVAAGAILAGTLAILAFLTAATLLASAYTKRAWHAGLAVVGTVGAFGLLGASASFGAKGAYRELFGPFGWFTLVLQRPLEMAFPNPFRVVPEGSAVAVPLAFVLLAVATVLCAGALVRRLRRVEGLL